LGRRQLRASRDALPLGMGSERSPSAPLPWPCRTSSPAICGSWPPDCAPCPDCPVAGDAMDRCLLGPLQDLLKCSPRRPILELEYALADNASWEGASQFCSQLRSQLEADSLPVSSEGSPSRVASLWLVAKGMPRTMVSCRVFFTTATIGRSRRPFAGLLPQVGCLPSRCAAP